MLVFRGISAPLHDLAMDFLFSSLLGELRINGIQPEFDIFLLVDLFPRVPEVFPPLIWPYPYGLGV